MDDDAPFVAQVVRDGHEQGDSSNVDEAELSEMEMGLGREAGRPPQRLFPIVVAVQIYLTGHGDAAPVAFTVVNLQWPDGFGFIGFRRSGNR